MRQVKHAAVAWTFDDRLLLSGGRSDVYPEQF